MRFFSKAFKAVNHSAAGEVTKDWIPYNRMHGMGSLVSEAGIEIDEEVAKTNSAVFACQRAISESIAILPKGIFKRNKQTRAIELQSDHPTLRVLKTAANPIQTPFIFFNNCQRSILSSGDAFAEIQFSKKTGDVIALWPILSSRVTPTIVETGNELDIIYKINLPNGKQVILPKDKVLHVAGIGFDGIRGRPLIEFMVNAVGQAQALEKYSSLFFKQGAQMPGYVSVPDTFTVEQIENLKSHYSVINEGLSNAHRLKFLYESAKFEGAGHSPADSQMTESRVLQIQEVARYHRIPLPKIQEYSKGVGYQSLEHLNIDFVNDTLTPYIVNWEQELNRKLLLEDSGEYIKFNVNALLRGDSKARSTYYRTMVFTGLMTQNEARELEELPPMDGGDQLMIPLNMSIDGKVAGESDKSKDGNERIQD